LRALVLGFCVTGAGRGIEFPFPALLKSGTIQTGQTALVVSAGTFGKIGGFSLSRGGAPFLCGLRFCAPLFQIFLIPGIPLPPFFAFGLGWRFFAGYFSYCLPQ
jgi:hypothetical protein